MASAADIVEFGSRTGDGGVDGAALNACMRSEVTMTTGLRGKSAWRRGAGMAALVAVVMVAACGRHGAPEAGKSAPPDGVDSADGQSCFIVHGSADANDAGLYAAAQTGDLAAVAQAIAAGAEVNAGDRLKRTPLFAATYCNRPQVAGLLIDRGGNVNAKDFDGMSPLHVAAITGGVDVAKVLLDKGADIDGRDADDRTPLLLAAATDEADMVSLLVARGANVGLRDKNGLTAAGLAAKNGHDSIAARLKEAQAAARAAGKKNRASAGGPHALVGSGAATKP
jgi:hypothetical protein